jgi:hypothetical protein
MFKSWSRRPRVRRPAPPRRAGWRPRLEALEDRRLLAVLMVMDHVDGPCIPFAPLRLRCAIAQANALPGHDAIFFETVSQDIIVQNQPLPAITDTLSIDGFWN